MTAIWLCADFFSTFRVPSETLPGRTYRITAASLNIECTCPAFRKSAWPHPPCKHIRRLYETACFWNSLQPNPGTAQVRPASVADRAPLVDGTCPQCGGPLCKIEIAA